ncbi:hypothetical protein BIY24_11380 [Halobacteriovorax marinus]|uniref:GNAT family N-acetyltransferase n=1 Tax=Halobacteriovorax marinus TaxID=97084 RepID=UPI000BC35121|nr:peptidogalycan biosysnthesis protein [Halobacteriovorax marinus]ATH08529.1 hypothetical protein BIY24_11380 [Halobacteriovorax marinus]
MEVQIFNSINDIKEIDWNQLVHSDDIFNKYHFHRALENSKSIGAERGQLPFYITIREDKELQAACVVYLKTHSYGEYIFDWSWADFVERSGHSYYPKLVAQNPFTPVINRKFLGDLQFIPQLLEEIDTLAKNLKCSSTHLLFLENNESKKVSDSYKSRSSFQYHWKNRDYKSFEHFLNSLKSRKSKQIRKERDSDLLIKVIEGSELSNFGSKFYALYQSTIDKKRSFAYLTPEFFNYIFNHLQESTMLIAAFKEQNLVAASLFFKGEKKLYGRYWGALEEYKNLHFELCYYQGIEYSIKYNYETFEAGAQGEHKIPRGFEPTLINSAHCIYNELFQEPIYKFIDQEALEVEKIISELSHRLPFKKV